jgi:peptidoglycan/LPS O-acetylase OafA/YrhL
MTASAASLLLGIGCYYFVELPLIRLMHLRAPKKSAAAIF